MFTTLIGLAIEYTIGWRVYVDDEVYGIDFAEHGESAYDLDGTLGRCTRCTGPVPAAHPKSRSTEGALA